ncbi:MAG: hypothetical protein ACK53Z_00205 [Betaproteobacteria bacterium]|jgi:hypothetical protein
MSSRTGEEDAELSAALGWPGGISEPLLDRAALLRMVASAAVELASMRRCFEAADRERSGLRDRAERAEAERDALRADAERYRWLFCHDDSKTSRVNSVWRLWHGQSDWDDTIDAAMRDAK